MKNVNKRAFTLIELLIVVAIIAILAAIAVPNFLEAQTRSKVSRVKADMRSLATAIGSYQVDHNAYPPDGDDLQFPDPFVDFDAALRLHVVTTPIAYMTSLPTDPFNKDKVPFDPGNPFNPMPLLFTGVPPYTFVYNTFGGFYPNPQLPSAPVNEGHPDNYTLSSLGPSRRFDSAAVGFRLHYDPTNGTISEGDIHRSEGERIDP